MRLYAVKPLKYGTRRLLPGDTFEATPREARLWIATKRAREASSPVAPPQPVEKPVSAPEPQADPAAEEMKALRETYEATIGRRPFMGWDAVTLRTKIAEAQADDDA